MSAFDDPFIGVCIEARTRAMNGGYENCPQLDATRARRYYAEAAARYHDRADMGAIIHLVLNLNEPFDSDDERYGYAVAIGLGFHRMRVRREDALEEHDRAHPTPPIEVYEQEP